MNKTELVAAIANATGIERDDVDKVVKAFVEVVSDELAGDGKVQLIGFGTFETAKRAAHEGRNPQTGETVMVAASKAPKFKAGKSLKDRVNGKKD
ncbi:MAG: HU family DNA-binding protein [Lachnospiraceae bacterium]|nr:HU family DNA-binding protein [Lachnospiraceae bacterium]